MGRAFPVLDRLRSGHPLSGDDLLSAIQGASDDGWEDAQLGAFLMGVAIRGVDAQAAGVLTRAMIDSGESWDLGAAWRTDQETTLLGDKHSTGGVGDKTSFILGPILAACEQPVVMLTGRGLGHTGGTADKLEAIPGLRLDLDRDRTLAVLREVGFAVGVPTATIAPADRRLYALRDITATVSSIPLVVASILSKKLATGADVLALDVKTGDGAFFQDRDQARELAQLLVATAQELGCRASALITDMSQPLGRWAGHSVEVEEALACLEGEGPDDLMEVTYALCEELASLAGRPLSRSALETAVSSGRAREAFDLWARSQGAEAAWLTAPSFEKAPVEAVLKAPQAGVLTVVSNRQLGLLLGEAGGGRARQGDAIDIGVALGVESRLGDTVEAGQPLARVYLRRPDEDLVRRFAACFEVDGDISTSFAAPPLIYERIGKDDA